MTRSQTFPKKIWILWLQGYDNMPEKVKKCYNTWQKHNPDWEIILLDKEKINSYLNISIPLQQRAAQLPNVTQSEIIRLNLLKKYGGVWADATCFCCRPLDEWLPKYMNSGFFAFSKPGKDRMISSWFLAANKGNELIDIYCKRVNRFWLENRRLTFWHKKTDLFRRVFRRLRVYHYLMRNPVRWHSFVMIKVFKIYHYFWFHYFFEKLYKEDSLFKKNWDATPKFSADIPHAVAIHGLLKPINKDIKEHIDNQKAPVYKISWKIDSAKILKGITIHYLLYENDYIRE